MYLLMSVLIPGFALMLGIMGIQQWQRRYYIAATFSLFFAILLALAGAWLILNRLGDV